MPGAETVVVGGGLVGAAAAFELVARGVDTLLIDRAHPGRATDAGAGILSPETSLEADEATAAFAGAAGAHHRRLEARLREEGIADTGYAPVGALRLAQREGEDPWMEEAVALLTRRWPGAVTEVDPAEAAERFPPLGPVRRALFSPGAARLDGRLQRAALLEAAARRGLRRVAAEVTGLEGAGGRLGTVVAGNRRISCGAVLLCAGAWAEPLGRALGVSLPVRPVKGQIVHLCLEGADSTAWPIVQPVLSHYLVSWPGGRVACGGTFEPEAGYDHRPTAAGLRELLREGLRTAPGLGPATLVEVRVGLRPGSPDDRPLVGPVPGWDNVWAAVGHGPEGLLLGPYSAALLADLVTGGTPGPELAPLDPGRFSR
jgi:D-amino-acid dehydrogenase